jgi:HEAT repeat protein
MTEQPQGEATAQPEDGTEEEVARLLEALLDAPAVEEAGLQSDLSRLGERGVASLIKRLTSDHATVRYYAADALGVIGDPRAREPLYQLLADPDIGVRIAAVYSLVQLGDLPMDRLVRDLHAADARVRSSVALIVGLLRDHHAIAELITLLTDLDSEVRGQAAYALGDIGDARAVEPLIRALRDKDASVRIAGARALGDLRDQRAVEPLLALVGDDDNLVRGWVAQALGLLGGDTVRGPLGNLVHDADPFVRQHAAQALCQLPPTSE